MTKIINNNLEHTVRRLYWTDNMTIQEIGSELGVSPDAIAYCMKKHSIPRRTQKENRALSFEKKAVSFYEKKNLTLQEQKLRLAALMLYWAEGAKQVLGIGSILQIVTQR